MTNIFYQYTIWPFFSSILVIWFGGLVILKNKESQVNRSLFCAIFAIFVWLFATALMLTDSDPGWQVFWDKLVYAGAVWIPVTIYQFGLSVAHKKNNKLLWLGYALSLFFMAVSFTDLFVSGAYHYQWGVHRQARIFHDLFLVYFATYILLFFFEIYKYKKKVTGLEKVQMNYILISFFVLALSSTAFLPAYGIDISPFQYLFAVLCVLILTLAITKYHLFATKVILTETLVGIMGIILVVLPFLMPTISLKILTFSVFCLFCFFGYYLIKATHEESDQREMAERIIIRERALREDAEQLAGNLQRLDQAKNQFMLSTQHHLRSPLTVIQGYLSLIEEGVYGKINKKVAQKVHNALAESQKLIKVVNDLLDMAKYQMNENTVERQTSNIVAILRDVISDLFQTAGKKNLKLDYQDSGQLPSVVINAKGIREALYNIIDNAIKYTEQGGVTVRSELINTNILISITDTGIGMEEIDRLGLFKRTFERGDKAKAINTTGKGIGLYLSAQMVLANGGNIWVMSKGRGSGTTFYIELPIADSKAVTPPSVPTKSEKIDQLYESANLSKPE